MYTLFAGDRYYPRGGLDDICGTYASLEEAIKAFESSDYDWGHVSVGLERVKTFYRHSD